ncbi:hypothetical protein [Pseudomonas sp. FSL W7-0098]|uniref:hypothetical protein n=1 Tax=Pseudomonas sp. FSL W7-0098 TaxID=2496120 RepID=UPI00110CBC33|nr:hypothetical protein [Pseudomonas sp. FSL W7-0098]
MSSNYAVWQHKKANSRMDMTLDILNSMRARKSPASKITELAEIICQTIRAVEQRQVLAEGKKYRPIDNSTLLRADGKYRPLLDAYMIERRMHAGDLESAVVDPIVRRMIVSKNINIADLTCKLDRAHKRIEHQNKRFENKMWPVAAVNFDVDDMGRAADVLFDMLIGTELFKFDEQTGDVLFVTRARRVAISRQDIATFTNWRKARLANVSSVDLVS